MVVVWSNSAKVELRKAFEYIALESLQNAQMIRDTLIVLPLICLKILKNTPWINLKKIMMAHGGLLKSIITAFLIVS